MTFAVHKTLDVLVFRPIIQAMSADALPRALVTTARVPLLFQRVSVVVQRFNPVLLHDSFCVEDQQD